MDKKQKLTTQLLNLRNRADQQLPPKRGQNIAAMSLEDISGLIHELETHQIELEMQNDELQNTQHSLLEILDQYTELYDFAPVGYVSISTEGLIIQSNLTFCNMIGIYRQELLTRRLSSFINTDDQDDYYTYLNKVKRSTEAQHCELRLDTLSQNSIWAKFTSSYINNANDENLQIRLIISDINEQKIAETEQIRLQRELHQSQKMEALGQFTGGIAHDFNNILGIILGYAGLALRKCKKENQLELVTKLKHIQTAGERARDLVSQLMDFSHGKAINKSPLHFPPVVVEQIKMLSSTLPSSINIDTNIDKNLPDVVMDTAQLNLILMNLCLNARDAMSGTGNLTINLGMAKGMDAVCTVCHTKISGDWVELSVSDTANGIDPKDIESIFNPFFTTKPVGKGTGLGLSIILGIVKSYGGHILIESGAGRGSTFRLFFKAVAESTV